MTNDELVVFVSFNIGLEFFVVVGSIEVKWIYIRVILYVGIDTPS